MKEIIGDRGKRKRYDPDLARKINEAVRKGELETKVSEDKGTDVDIEAICKKYEEYMNLDKMSIDEDDDIPYDLVFSLKPTREQILKFSKKLVDYTELEDFEERTSDYLTALMQMSEDDNFFLDFNELNKKRKVLDCIGYKLEGKNVEVKGDVGDSVGYASENVEITVNGDAGDKVGEYSEKCKITINGNAGEWVGLGAEDSEIYIKGDFNLRDESEDFKSVIYQFKDGKYEKVCPMD